MKKVLLCERSFSGHRRVYLKWLSKIPGIEFFSFAPENTDLSNGHYFKYDIINDKTIFGFFRWVKKIKKIVIENNIDIVHILDGDSIMKFFGIGFSVIEVEKLIITYHHFFGGIIRKLSYKAMNAANGSLSIAHTEAVRDSLLNVGLKNVKICRYPAFTFKNIAQRNAFECKKYYNVPQNVPVIGIIGGMSDYKNIIPFLEIMQNCKEKFHILLCGKGSDEFCNQVKVAVESYSENVTMKIETLTDDEYEMAIMASDVVYCLYNHSFDGASGPLTDGVCANKMILSCAHGSLGSIVTKNHLGYTAECTDSDEILGKATKAINEAKGFIYDDEANAYRKSLMPEFFQKTYKSIYESV